MMKYTVIGYYEDNGQTFMETVRAKSASDAVWETCKKLHDVDPAMINIVAVLNVISVDKQKFSEDLGDIAWAQDWDTPGVCTAEDVPNIHPLQL